MAKFYLLHSCDFLCNTQKNLLRYCISNQSKPEHTQLMHWFSSAFHIVTTFFDNLGRWYHLQKLQNSTWRGTDKWSMSIPLYEIVVPRMLLFLSQGISCGTVGILNKKIKSTQNILVGSAIFNEIISSQIFISIYRSD